MVINVSDKLLKNLGVTDYNSNDAIVSLYCFNILVYQDSKNILLENLDYDFFNRLSKYKKNLRFIGLIKNNNFILKTIHYYLESGTVNLIIQKKIIKIFKDYGIKITFAANKTKSNKKIKVNGININLTF